MYFLKKQFILVLGDIRPNKKIVIVIVPVHVPKLGRSVDFQFLIFMLSSFPMTWSFKSLYMGKTQYMQLLSLIIAIESHPYI